MTKSVPKDGSWLVLSILAIPALWMQSGAMAVYYDTTMLGGLGLTLLYSLGFVAIIGFFLHVVPNIFNIIGVTFIVIVILATMGYEFIHNCIVKKPASNGSSG